MENTKTFKIDFGKNRVLGFTDDLDALKQSIKMYLSVPRFEHIIFTRNYGHDFKKCIGESKEYVLGVAKRFVHECLSTDDRIIDVANFELSTENESLFIRFKITSIYGDYIETWEVAR
ncbi:MAG: DUF2634 domain-containing protein [Anaerorhabdus sp.]|uniref:DUF2634 domain-containing protein n=1 Tax=Anaerorhabdus sp. TaxID=1872524 RepID=UPI003A8C4F14